jgi:hypothetical protein
VYATEFELALVSTKKKLMMDKIKQNGEHTGVHSTTSVLTAAFTGVAPG